MRISLLLLILVFPVLLAAQDAIYIRDPGPRRPVDASDAFLLRYTVPELLDSAARAQLRAKAAAYAAQQQLLKPEDCVYFGDAAARFFDGLNFDLFRNGRNGYPPSLRFYADRNKSYVDSIFSINLYTPGVMTNYMRPFYFRKYEVTNAEYREFTNWVRDSIAMRMLAQNGYEEQYLIAEWDWIKMQKKAHPDSAEYYEDRYDGGNPPLNWQEKVRWDEEDLDYKAALNGMYLPENERYYRRKEIDTRKLIYKYVDEHNELHVLPIYPDTLCWVHDFPSGFREPLTNMYFWHPAYNNYPVVGVNYHQVKAYLHWKTKMEQQKLDGKGVKVKIELALPSEIEWEMAATAQQRDGKALSYGEGWSGLADHSWKTDLFLDSMAFLKETIRLIHDSSFTEVLPPEPVESYGIFGYVTVRDGSYRNPYVVETDTITGKDGKRYERRRRYYTATVTRRNYFAPHRDAAPDHYPLTAPADLRRVKPVTKAPQPPQLSPVPGTGKPTVIDNSVILTQLDANQISWMGGNVSEWIEADYSAWAVAFELRRKMLAMLQPQDAQLALANETYFDSFNAKNGKLVRGANWFDERYGNIGTKNPAGANAKTFVDPGKAHCTLGFRYVVRVK